MKLKYIPCFVIILSFLSLVSGVTLNPGTVLNTTLSNSSMTFSIAVTTTNLTIEPTYIYLLSVSYFKDGETKTCDSITHSTSNTNLDSSDFPCTGPSDVVTPPPSTEGPGGPSGGGGITYECSNDSDCESNQYCFERKCYDAECFEDSDCKEDESCWNHRCVKWFDMEILEFESPVRIGEFFDFTYFLKAVAEINGDVEIKFWIEQNGNIVTSGQDTIYFSSFEEKTKTKKLFLPNDISSGTYIFYIEVTYGTYTASAHRTIGIIVDEDSATIILPPKIKDITKYIIYGLIGLIVFILFLIFYFERRKIKESVAKRRWIKEHKVLISTFLLFIVLGVLAYYLKIYESVAVWITEAILSNNLYYILGFLFSFLILVIVIIIIKYEYKKLGKSITSYRRDIKEASKKIKKEKEKSIKANRVNQKLKLKLRSLNKAYSEGHISKESYEKGMKRIKDMIG